MLRSFPRIRRATQRTSVPVSRGFRECCIKVGRKKCFQPPHAHKHARKRPLIELAAVSGRCECQELLLGRFPSGLCLTTKRKTAQASSMKCWSSFSISIGICSYVIVSVANCRILRTKASSRSWVSAESDSALWLAIAWVFSSYCRMAWQRPRCVSRNPRKKTSQMKIGSLSVCGA